MRTSISLYKMMKNYLLVAFICLISNTVALAQGKIKWTKDYDEGLKLAKKEGKPVMLYFGSLS